MTFRGFLKTLSYILGIFITVLILSGISYLIIDGINKKSNVMDIGDYSPISTLVVSETPTYKSKFPFVDVHSHHWDMPVKDLSKLVTEMDSLNMAYLINLSGSGFGAFSGKQELMDLNLTKSLENVNENYPDRFGVFLNLDLAKIDKPDFEKNNIMQIENAVSQGVIGLKIYKNLGLTLRDSRNIRVPVDDDRLSHIWETCAKFNIPVLIHSGEPKAFFDPVDKFNERWLHAREKPRSFRPSDKYPTFDQVMYEQEQLFKKHPTTTFINAHFGWYGNDLGRLSKQLSELTNVYVEFGAVINELGRQPSTARRFFEDYQDRILFGKDTYKMDEYYIYFQVLETDDEYIEYYRKRHGLWRLYGLNLSDEILKKVYYQNALKIFPNINPNLFK